MTTTDVSLGFGRKTLLIADQHLIQAGEYRAHRDDLGRRKGDDRQAVDQ
ncbi:hypothetical protein [Mycolicibacterium sp. P1-5]|nr:hypothetical protein [Mycolicibacterium sp. P1-5]